ncbi:T9SS type A sorting domain-containing protein [Apibacter sp. HY039]|uniref:T9SS type A sorting domain-containing protein n=1 Tax=Apibacter sp. HY039 TaxID=2501476 RepID=UPI000FEB69A9|nr:T9SS type A sorting domain-containing protein [Apibacter sp. HY039]
MVKVLSFIFIFLSFNLVVAKNELPTQTSYINFNEKTTRSLLFPNPATDFTIIKNTTSTKIKNISVLSMVGSSVINREISDNNARQELNVAKLPTGRYFIKVSYADGEVEILTLIKI